MAQEKNYVPFESISEKFYDELKSSMKEHPEYKDSFKAHYRDIKIRFGEIPISSLGTCRKYAIKAGLWVSHEGPAEEDSDDEVKYPSIANLSGVFAECSISQPKTVPSLIIEAYAVLLGKDIDDSKGFKTLIAEFVGKTEDEALEAEVARGVELIDKAEAIWRFAKRNDRS
jgi:hypothetical protein